ncbi:hypothetical protein [Brevibacillus sp. 179-C9.3 HS]|uniref:hypothetical protein n=1 Tax=unclassified Brevibacillus TaxID=2684853 RepID=UPI0039A1D39B
MGEVKVKFTVVSKAGSASFQDTETIHRESFDLLRENLQAWEEKLLTTAIQHLLSNEYGPEIVQGMRVTFQNEKESQPITG